MGSFPPDLRSVPGLEISEVGLNNQVIEPDDRIGHRERRPPLTKQVLAPVDETGGLEQAELVGERCRFAS